MPTTTRTVFLTDENGNPLIDEQRNMRTLSFSLMQGYSYRLVERASIVSATYAQVVGYSTATGQTIAGVENASEFDVGDFGIVQYAISDRNNTIGYVTCKVIAVGADSLTVNGIGISVAGADGKDGAPGADGKDGAATVQIGTVTTGAAGSQASVTNVGADNAAILNFTIPRGDTGAQGIQGEPGTPGADGQDGAPGADGKDGVTFTPSVDPNGDLSWSNDGGRPNPETVNLRGAQGEAATIQVGQVTTGAAGSEAVVTNVGTANAAILNFTIPRGAQGERGIQGEPGTAGKDGTNGQDGADGADGAAATIQIGEVITGAPGTNASVENTGTENAAILKITIPRGNAGEQGEQGEPGQKGADGKDGADGAPGAAATIQIGTVTTGAAGSQAAVTNTGTANAAILNFTIPRGNTGAQGNPGNDGAPGADGASGVTDVTAGTPTEQDGYTVTPVTFNFEQGNSKTVNIQAKNGGGGGLQVQSIAVSTNESMETLEMAIYNIASTHSLVSVVVGSIAENDISFEIEGQQYRMNSPCFSIDAGGIRKATGMYFPLNSMGQPQENAVLAQGELLLLFGTYLLRAQGASATDDAAVFPTNVTLRSNTYFVYYQ